MRTRSGRPAVRVLASLTAAGLLLTGLSAAAVADTGSADGGADPTPPDGAAQVDAPVPDLAWVPCEGEGLEAFECASAEVPTDYDEPAGETTTIALTRLPATDPDQRIGSLFLNFGGPGGPGVGTMHQLGGEFLDPQVHARFDVIGFDPRGVGLSDPVTCFPDQATENAFLADSDAFPTTKKETREFVALFGATALACEALSGDRIEHASTANVARDMDLLRQAVGDEELSYLGYSYGTVLGATYSALFPDRVRALVLDGTLDPTAWSGGEGSIGLRTGQGVAASETWGEFLAECAAAGPESCALAALGDPTAVTEELFDRLEATPVPVTQPDGSTLEIGYDEAVAYAFSGLYSPAAWTDLALMLAQLSVATEPQPALMAQRLDESAGASATSDESLGDLLRRLGLIEDYPSLGNALAAMCVDGDHPLDVWDYPAQAAAAAQEAPHFGEFRSWVGLQCEFVDYTDEDAYLGPWEQQTEAPVMVIGTRYDPATPYSFTQPYADHYPDASVMTVEGYGHTTLGASTCANAAIAEYLTTLEATDGAVCDQDVAPFSTPAGEPTPDDALLLAPPVPAAAGV